MPGQIHPNDVKEFDKIIDFCERNLLEKSKTVRAKSDLKAISEKLDSLLQPIQSAAKGEVKDVVKQHQEFKVAFDYSLPAGSKGSEINDDEQREYSTEDIYRILDRRVRDLKDDKAKFDNLIWANDPEGIEYNPKKVFDSQVEAAKKLKEGEALMVPVISNRHWTGGVFRMQKGKLQFVYNDSLGKPMKEASSLMASWFDDYADDIEVIDLQIKQQGNDLNCGPWMIHNLFEIASNVGLEEELKKKLGQAVDPKKLREADAKTLKEEQVDRDETMKMLDEIKERAICGKMSSLFDGFKEEGRMSDEGKISCNSEDEARALAEKIKKSYEDIGVKPCGLKQDGNTWVVQLPEQCRGRDPFRMSKNELDNLKKELQPPFQSAVSPRAEGNILDSEKNGPEQAAPLR